MHIHGSEEIVIIGLTVNILGVTVIATALFIFSYV